MLSNNSPRRRFQEGSQMKDILSGNTDQPINRPSTKLNSKFVGGQSQLGSIIISNNDESGVDAEWRKGNMETRERMLWNQRGEMKSLMGGYAAVDVPVAAATGRRHFDQKPGESVPVVAEVVVPPAAPIQSGVQWASSSNGLGSVQNRPSSRVLRAPGGGSSIIFG